MPMQVFAHVLYAVRATENKGILYSRQLWWLWGKQIVERDHQQKSVRRQVVQIRDDEDLNL